MKTHILNLFKFNNLHEINFSFKLVKFDLGYLEYDPKELNKCIEKIEWQVASNIEGPASAIVIEGKRFIAIPAESILTLKAASANSISVPLDLVNDIHEIKLGDNHYKNLILKFLDFAIRNHLQDKHQLWSLNTYQFYLKNPVFRSENSDVDMFGGFIYRLIEDKGDYYITLNPTYKYTSRTYLSDLVNSSNSSDLLRWLKGNYYLYQNGDNWYQIEICSFGKPIVEHEFIGKNSAVYKVKNYILEKTHNHKFNVEGLLKNEHLSLLYKYPNRDMEPHHGATSLAKRLFRTDEPEVKNLHSKAILPPYNRFQYIEQNISRFFQDIDWNNKRLSISPTAVNEKLPFFPIPELKYNNGKILKTKDRIADNDSVDLRDFGFERKKWIIENQILKQSMFVPQYLIVPHFVEQKLAKTFQKHIEGYLKNLSPNFPGFQLITYKANLNDAATVQVNAIESAFKLNKISNGCALFLLPFGHKTSNKKIKNFHDCLKKKFFPDMKFQCASLNHIQSFYDSYPDINNIYHFKPKPQLESKYKSYVFNLVMEILVINRKWSYALNKGLNYDIYIGIDVHERYAGFCFFYKNGEEIVFDHKEIPLIAGDKRKRAEKIKVETIVPKLLEKLEVHIPKYATNPNGIVILRDGRSFGQEEIALKSVIEQLHIKGLLNKETIKWGVIDLYKKNAIPIRAAVKTDGFDKLDNTRAGTYKIVNNTDGYIFNTGFPFRINGTVNPIHVSLKDGNIDFTKAIQDVFDQTILAFSAPDRPNSLPICIKLIDSYLSPVAANFRDMEEEIEEVEVIND